MNQYDVIIIGAGIAGMTAAIYARRAGKTVLVLEKAVRGGQIVNAPAVENWPGEVAISGADLIEKIYHQADNLGVEFEYGEVETIIKQGERDFVVKSDAGNYAAGAIIIAVGAAPRKISDKQAADAKGRTISYCAICDGALCKNKPVVVVGSGNTAKQEIAYLEGIASKVYHIHHDDPIPEEAEAIFVAIGRVPETQFLQGLVELTNEGYVAAGEDCVTSCLGVFVAGDCRTKSVRQLVTAAGDGAVAAGAAVKYLDDK